MRESTTATDPVARVSALALLLFGIAWFAVTGIGTALDSRPVDFEVLFGGAKAFLAGGDPYLQADMQRALGWGSEREIGVQITLPALFAALAPLAALPLDYEGAARAWTWIGVVAVLGSLVALLRLGRIPLRSTTAVVVVACGLLLGSFRSVLWLGNTDIVALCLCLVGLACAVENRTVAAVVLLVGAMSLKIHSVGLFAFYLFFRGHRTVAVLSVAGWLAVNAVVALILGENAPGWLDTWRQVWSSDAAIEANGIDPRNPELHLFTHLRAGLYAMDLNARTSLIIGILVCGTLLAWTLLRGRHASGRGRQLLLELAIVAMVGQLIVYHRAASAVFLVLPLGWALMSLGRRRDVPAAAFVALACFAVGLVNTQYLYHSLAGGGVVPAGVSGSWFGEVLLTYHVVWIDLAMLVVMVVVQSGRSPRDHHDR